MRRRWGAHLVVALVLGVMPSVAAQVARDAAKPPARRSGSAAVSGAVTLGDAARTPVRRAVVTLKASDGADAFAAVSDEEGRFSIERVPAGRYTLSAEKPAHLTVALGARRPGGAGTTLVVKEGQHITDLHVVAPRGAVLAGRVTLANGQPLANTQVVAVPTRLVTSGGAFPLGTREFRTDDLGEFRMFGLAPGTYVVAALPTFGRADIDRLPDQAITDLLRHLQQPTGRAPDARTLATRVVFAPTYFPGTPSVAEATVLRMEVGQQREDLSFAVAPFPSAVVSGSVVTPGGAPASTAALTLEAIGPTLPAMARVSPRVERSSSDGTFRLSGVPPGSYRLRARGTDAAVPQSATVEVNVAGVDVGAVVLVLEDAKQMAGRFSSRDAEPLPTLQGLKVSLVPVTGDSANALAGVLAPGVPRREATSDVQGRFAVTGLEGVEYSVSVTLPQTVSAAGWRVAQVLHNGADLRDRPLVFDRASIADVDVRLSRAATGLSGTLTAGEGAPASDYFIVVFPADRELWHRASPRIRVVRPAADGTYSVDNLPAGLYRVAALTDVEPGEEHEATFLDAVSPLSMEVTIIQGLTARQFIRIALPKF